jgi:peptidoglycan/LPS O-acetylase OafA/YrhL
VTIALLAAAPFWRQANYIAFGGAEYVNSWRGDLRYDALLTGCLLALLCRSPQWRERMSSPAISGGLAAGAAIAIVCFALSPAALRLGPLRALIPSVSFVGVAIVINHLMRSPRTIAGIAMNAAPLTWVGALSYSLYLWQQPLCYPGACLAMRAPASVAAVIALAAASHYLIERPFLRLRRPRETPAPEPPRDREPVRATPDNA